MALYERVVKRAAINRERAHPGLTLEPSSLPAALLAAACCCSPLAFLMTSLMASLIASLTTPLIPPLIASLISDGLSDGLSDALIRGTHPRASIAGLRHLCTLYCSTVCLCLNNSLTHWVVVAPGMMMMDAAVVLREHAF